jgi:hypothetical protein
MNMKKPLNRNKVIRKIREDKKKNTVAGGRARAGFLRLTRYRLTDILIPT